MWDIYRLRTHMWDICHLWMHMWYMLMEEGAMVTVIFHDIGMCWEWNGTVIVDYAYVWLIIHLIVDVVCLLDYYAIHYLRWVLHAWQNYFFLSWTSHPKTTLWPFIKLYSLCSSLKVSDKDLVKPDTEQVPEDRQQGIKPLLPFYFCFFWIDCWHVVISLGVYKFWSLKANFYVLKTLYLGRIMII